MNTFIELQSVRIDRDLVWLLMLTCINSLEKRQRNFCDELIAPLRREYLPTLAWSKTLDPQQIQYDDIRPYAPIELHRHKKNSIATL